MIDRLLEQHAALRRIAAELVDLAASDTPCDLDALADCRWRLYRLMLQHLSLEERCIYGPLDRDPRPELVATARRFRTELERDYAGMQANVDRWTPERLSAEWPSYSAIARAAMAQFVDRMDREEAELYPLVNGKPDIGVRTADDRNWAADGARIRERIESGMITPRQGVETR